MASPVDRGEDQLGAVVDRAFQVRIEVSGQRTPLRFTARLLEFGMMWFTKRSYTSAQSEVSANTKSDAGITEACSEVADSERDFALNDEKLVGTSAPTESLESCVSDIENVTPIGVVDSKVSDVEQSNLLAEIQKIARCQDQLQQLYASRIHSDEVQSKAIDRLHDELQEYKRSFVRQEMMPLFGDIIFCYDLACQYFHSASDCVEGNIADGSNTLQALRQMLLDILEKYGLESYRGEGETFDSKVQYRTESVDTEVEENDKRIAERGVEGFRSGATLVRREQVSVYRYIKPAP